MGVVYLKLTIRPSDHPTIAVPFLDKKWTAVFFYHRAFHYLCLRISHFRIILTIKYQS